MVNTTWASLQPQQGGPIAHPNDIDRAIEQARSNGYTLKLRVRAGIDAPEWAKRLDGSPIPMTYTAATVKKAGQSAGTIGRFWTPRFGAAYNDLQTKLAATYDGVPEIRQTDITRCSTIFAETYLRNTKDKANAKALISAGYTRAADDVATPSRWRRTRSGSDALEPVDEPLPGDRRGRLGEAGPEVHPCGDAVLPRGARCSLRAGEPLPVQHPHHGPELHGDLRRDEAARGPVRLPDGDGGQDRRLQRGAQVGCVVRRQVGGAAGRLRGVADGGMQTARARASDHSSPSNDT